MKELIEIENADVLRGDDHEKPLTKIKLDASVKKVLKDQGLNENFVPPLGDRICLRYNGNLSTGGTARDCTEEIHPYNARIAIRAAKALGLDIAGVDITAEDISRPIFDGNGAVIEINAAPGLKCIYPTKGSPKTLPGTYWTCCFRRKLIQFPLYRLPGPTVKLPQPA